MVGPVTSHNCTDFDLLIEKFELSLKEESLSCDEVLACAYCAGWAEARSAVVYDVNVDLVCMEIGQ